MKEHGQSGPRSEADVIELLDRFADAWNRHDLDALMSMMSDDCVFEASAGPDVGGQRARDSTLIRLTSGTRVSRRGWLMTTDATP
jgi:ketosteroid isomerase-like protein